MVEFAIIIPVLLLVLLTVMEFGFVFSHHITMEYATREGARMGAALANGSVAFDCKDVDDQIVAAVQRVLTSAGSQIDINQVGEIRIYKANATGTEQGVVNVWSLGNGGPKVDGVRLLFKKDSGNWDACSRNNAGLGLTDSIGVSLGYRYRYVTPLGSMLGLVGSPVIPMSDRTVMALNPS
jgi:Flp pilus assembly protein TadG